MSYTRKEKAMVKENIQEKKKKISGIVKNHVTTTTKNPIQIFRIYSVIILYNSHTENG